MLNKKALSLWILVLLSFGLTACSSGTKTSHKRQTSIYAKKGVGLVNRGDSASVIRALAQQQRDWRGTRYRLGGNSRDGVDCSGFTQITFRELFGIDLPRMTVEQARVGSRVSRDELRAGDLVVFRTGRGPNGGHVGIYVENGRFLHASTKGGVIYSDINSPYWSRTFWQGRRI